MIFEDPTRLRWRAAMAVFVVMSLIGLFLLIDFSISLVTNPPLPRLPKLVDDRGRVLGSGIEQDASKAAVIRPATTRPASRPATMPFRSHEKMAARFSAKSFVTTAFVVQDDPDSVDALRANVSHLDVVFPDWYSFSTSSGTFHEQIAPAVAKLLADHRVLVFPRLSNTDAKGVWQGDEAVALFRDTEASEVFITNLIRKLQQAHAHGINLDIENIGASDREVYLEWLDTLIDQFHRHKLYVTVDVPMNDEGFDYEALGQMADAVVVMAYDEHYAGGTPGPVAGMEWFTDGVEEMAKRIPPAKLIVALGAYGYDWTVGAKREARPLGFAQAMVLAGDFGAEVETQSGSLNNRFSYRDDAGAGHEVWFLDAVTAWNQFCRIRESKVYGVSLWRLGLEEPGVWEFLACPDLNRFDPAALKTVKCVQRVLPPQGEGELLKVRGLPQNGKREITFDGRMIDYSTYDAIPKYFVVENFGHSAQPRVALTFDDGPDPVWTPQILRVLKANNVRAAFFVVGDQAQRAPKLVRQEVHDGHLVGNHTFLHPNIQTISTTRLKIELNATQRLIESITGRQTLLFRAPYDTDSTPQSPAELVPLYAAGQLGYITVGAEIDSSDYERPGADRIVQNVLARLQATGANIVVLHDAGGDRSQTVAALGKLIPRLRQEGYELVTIDELLGVLPKALMPRITVSERLVILGDETLTWFRTWGWFFLVILFFATTIISVGRIIFLGIFVFRSHKLQQYKDTGFTPPVLVLVPAYNEAKVIGRTLDALLQSDYPNFSVLVVDDGSTDDTAAIVRRAAHKHPRIRVITKPNGGKFSALNLGFQQAEEEHIVTIDADTIVLPETIRQLIAPFANPGVDAVCGNVQVGNVKNILTAFQDVEYVTSQNYDRRAFDALNCISVVPGATGAWKRSAVLRVQGYSDSTLTEDADLTLTVLEGGGRIVYAPRARSITEAPETVGALFKQRFRWSFGTFQCLWKHRHNFGRGGLGWIAMPNMLLFQVLFPILSPIGDLVLILSLLRGDYRAVLHGYILFVLMDLTGSLIAFTLDKRRWRNIWVVLVQRFFYRQFMYIVTFKSIIAAIKGRRHGWNKLDRQASVNLVTAVPQPAQ